MRAIALVLVAAATGCGNLTPGGIGEATLAVTGNVPAPAPAPGLPGFVAAPVTAPLPSSHDSIDEAEEAEGKVHVKFRVSLVSAGGFETRLGPEEIELEVDLQGVEEPPEVTQQVTATRYTQIRFVFTEIKAEVEGGLVINGTPVMGELHVELEDVSLLVTRPVDLDVPDGGSVQLTLDLNAPAWLTAVDPVTLTVDEQVFADLIDVVTP